MKAEQFNEAIAIIACFHSTEIKINTPTNGFVGDLGKEDYRIHITKCVPGVISQLIASGFRVGMNEDGAYIDKSY